jgi:hypothetical protein
MEVMTTVEPGVWDAVLKEVGTYDYYNLSAFHRLWELRGHGKAEMLVYREGGHTVLYPMLVRNIDIPPVSHEGLKDATCVPGLVGPLSSHTVPEDIRQRFIQALQSYFEESRIIAAFSRLNFLFDQQPLFDGYGETVYQWREVSLDLTISEEEQFARYRRDHRKTVRKLTEAGFTCEEVGPEFLDEFIRVYYDTMDRVGAESAYYFDRAYFDCLFNEMADVTHMFACWDGDRAAAVGLYFECSGIVHAYLGGTDPDYIQRSPLKLLNDSVRRWAVARGDRIYHLGGGRDSLYEQKMAYGGRSHEYFTWRHVVDPGAYQDVCRRVVESAGVEPDDSYFPKYRHPLLRGDS